MVDDFLTWSFTKNLAGSAVVSGSPGSNFSQVNVPVFLDFVQRPVSIAGTQHENCVISLKHF